MKVGNNSDQTELALAAVRSATESGKAKSGEDTAATQRATQQSAQADSSTKVALSSAASLLSTPGGGPVFDSEKVQRIQEALANGTYVINPEAIASRLISNAKELLARAGDADANG